MDEKFKHKAKIVKTLEENLGGNLPDIGLGNNFLDIIPKTQAQIFISGTTLN